MSSGKFYGGLRETLGLTKEEAGRLIAIHFHGAINRRPREA
ncbi:MAG TPA: hypothetical protein VE844_04515 [Gammaproteobacteria bacterium]|nr:hypothetical protein [Gammaproteobacteria bacterium]